MQGKIKTYPWRKELKIIFNRKFKQKDPSLLKNPWVAQISSSNIILHTLSDRIERKLWFQWNIKSEKNLKSSWWTFMPK